MKRAALLLLAGGLSLTVPGLAAGLGLDDGPSLPDPVEEVGTEPVLIIRPILSLPGLSSTLSQIQSELGVPGTVPSGTPRL